MTMEYVDSLFLDKEKDVVIDFYKENNNFHYVLRTPNHNSGNLITNLAKLCNLDISYDENGLKIIKGDVPSFINEQNQRFHILKFNKKTIAVINTKDEVMSRATIPAISKTLMSQTKDYKQKIDRTLVRTYIEESYKFKTDVHTHMNANLYPDILLALGIYHQIKYPYYYVKKLGLKITPKQEKSLLTQREKVAKKFVNSELIGKYKERRIDDNTFVNFADLILNNIKDAKYNLDKIRTSLTILKDGQAVFTNLEKLYLYRYVFAKGIDSERKIKLKNIDKIPDKDIKNYLNKMIDDSNNPNYKDNSLLEDKLLWIGRMYKSQGIKYVEISNTTLVKNNDEPLDFLTSCHKILPLVEKETGVRIRFLAAMRRIPLTIVKDNVTPENYLRENLDVLKAIANDPYVVGSDFVGEEINEISELKPVIQELVELARNDKYFTIRIHAGENDGLKDNVSNAIKCVKDSLAKGQKMPKIRLGHGLYIPKLNSAKGKKLIKDLKDNNVVLEFQITSNVRLNNLTDLENHPIKEYLKNNVKCVQGTDGCGIYGTDSLDEQLALLNLMKLNRSEASKMCVVESEIINDSIKSFKIKSKKLKEKLNGRDLKQYYKEEINRNREISKKLKLNTLNKLLSKNVLKDQINDLPTNKIPVVIVGGSFNSDKRGVKTNKFDLRVIDELLQKLNPKKYFFVVGHKLNGYEKYLFEHKDKFEVYAVVPGDITTREKNILTKSNIKIRISPEPIGMGTYKSFNYEIFERRPSVVIAMDGNVAGANIIQEAKNGKAKALIYVSNNSPILKQKALSLQGYVNILEKDKDVKNMFKQIKKIRVTQKL